MYLNKIFLSILLCVSTVGLAVNRPLPTRMEKPPVIKPYPAIYPPRIPEASILVLRLRDEGGVADNLIKNTSLIATLTTASRPRPADITGIFETAFYEYQTFLDGCADMTPEDRLWTLQKERSKKRALVELTLADDPGATTFALMAMESEK